MFRPALLLTLLCASCAPDPGTVPLGEAERSWVRALRSARQAGWSYSEIGRMRALIEQAGPAQRDLCNITYDLADCRIDPAGSFGVLAACAEALAAGVPGDPLSAAVQVEARASFPAEAMVQTAGLAREARAMGVDPALFARVLDRAAVFGTPPWTAIQFLKDILAASKEAPAECQADLFEEALGRRGRHLEAQTVLAAYREAVRDGLPPKDLSVACRLRLRRGVAPAALAAWLKEIRGWPSPPISRGQALRLIAAGLARGLPDAEVAAFGAFLARNTIDARDAAILGERLEANVRAGLGGTRLLAETLENFSGARPTGPAPR